MAKTESLEKSTVFRYGNPVIMGTSEVRRAGKPSGAARIPYCNDEQIVTE